VPNCVEVAYAWIWCSGVVLVLFVTAAVTHLSLWGPALFEPVQLCHHGMAVLPVALVVDCFVVS
jgi:uncharacterized membrane protein YdcZ (DUF606 family)